MPGVRINQHYPERKKRPQCLSEHHFMLCWGKEPFGSYGWNKEHWDFVPATIILSKVNNELMLNGFSVKLWSNVPHTEMWNVLLTVLACTLLKNKKGFSGFPVILLSDELYWPLFCFFIWGYIRSYGTNNPVGWGHLPHTPADPAFISSILYSCPPPWNPSKSLGTNGWSGSMLINGSSLYICVLTCH